MLVRYYPVEYSPDIAFEHAIEFKSQWDLESSEWLAEDCANDYHSNHDGWESQWPLTLRIWDEKGVVLGDWTVDRDYDPVFNAWKKEVDK